MCQIKSENILTFADCAIFIKIYFISSLFFIFIKNGITNHEEMNENTIPKKTETPSVNIA